MDSLLVSGLLLGYAGGPHVAIRRPAAGQNPPAISGSFAWPLDHVFSATDTPRAYAEVAAQGTTPTPRGATPAPHVSLAIVDANGRVIKTLTPWPTSPEDAGDAIDERISLDGLARGAYTLRLTVDESRALDVRREVAFAIK